MSVHYRLMLPDDESAVVMLWSTVFNVPYNQEYERLTSDPSRYATTHIAIAEDDTVLAAAHYRIYERRDEQGLPQRVAECDPIATLPSSRCAGHASTLIRLALAAMTHQDCQWSLLVTSDMARSLYTRFGWKAVAIRYRRGAISPRRSTIPHGYAVTPYPLPTTAARWEPLSKLYTRYNNARPLTVVRDRAYWEGFLAPRLSQRITDERMVMLAAYDSQSATEMRGYCLVHFFPFGFLLVEIGSEPQDRETLTALVAAVGDEAERRGIQYGEVDLPFEEALDAAVAELFGMTLHLSDANERIMVRAINPTLTSDTVARTFSVPGAWYSPIDHF